MASVAISGCMLMRIAGLRVFHVASPLCGMNSALSRLPLASKPEATSMDVDALNQVSPTSQPRADLSWDLDAQPSWMLVLEGFCIRGVRG